LSVNLNVNAFGYNKKLNEFWGKKMNKNCCFLEFTIQIDEIDIDKSIIMITPIIGTSKHFDKLISEFDEHLLIRRYVL
jgi:hypothetical protein